MLYNNFLFILIPNIIISNIIYSQHLIHKYIDYSFTIACHYSCVVNTCIIIFFFLRIIIIAMFFSLFLIFFFPFPWV